MKNKFIMILSSLFLSGVTSSCVSEGISKDLFKRDVNQAIKIGMTRSEIKSLLTLYKFNEMDYDENLRKISAIKRTRYGFIVKTDIQLTALFDDEDLAIDIKIEELYTGP